MNDDNNYPEQKVRELTEQEKEDIREELSKGHRDIYEIAKQYNCSSSQVAGIKAWLKS